MKTWAVLLAATVLCGCSDKTAQKDAPPTAVSGPRDYLGLVHTDSLPAGVVRKAWVYLDSIGGHDYAVTAVSEGSRRMFWLDESADSGYWKVTKVLEFDKIPAGNELSIGSCTGLDIPKRELVAMTHREKPKGAASVLQVWRVDRANHEFMEIRPAGIVCP